MCLVTRLSASVHVLVLATVFDGVAVDLLAADVLACEAVAIRWS